jgi:signal transduction histidine kinase/CheY-like chemotaxis protein
MSNERVTAQSIQSPIDQVALEAPAHRARRLVRLQIGAIVLISMAAGLLGVLVVALPADDRSLPLLALGVVVLLGGLFVGLTDYVHGSSVTTLVQIASALRQSAAERAADLARANAALRRRDNERASLFADMSQELRSPLNAIAGRSRALLDTLDRTLTPEHRDHLHQIHEGGQGLLAIVNGTLDLARLDAGAITLNRGPVQVWAAVEEVAALLHPLAATRGLELERTISSDLPPVDADEGRLRQVLTTLVGNAVTSTVAGTVKVRAELAGDQIVIAVSDTGVGISREAQEVIFEPFRRAEPGAARYHGGTGLALAVAKRLVELMDGRMWLESEPGVGSTFSVTLPVAALPKSSPTASHRERAACDVVLVARPERAGQLVAALTQRRLAVTCVGGSDWLDAVEGTRPRLALIDVLQPQAEGWRGLAQLRSAGEHTGLAVGLVGLDYGAGRLALPGRLDVLVDSEADLGRAVQVMTRPGEIGSGRTLGCTLVVGADVAWRRRIVSMLESAGAQAVEATSPRDAEAVTERVAVRGLVLDVRMSDPGIVEWLSAAERIDVWRHLPITVVLPSLLTPRQQRELHLSSAVWSREGALSMDQLADRIAQCVVQTPRRPAALGAQAW